MKEENRLQPDEIKIVEAYLKGDEKSSDDTIVYLLGRLRAVKTEGDEVSKQLQELKELTASAIRHFTGLNSQYNAYARDLLTWVGKAEQKERAAFTPQERAKLLDMRRSTGKEVISSAKNG